MLTSCKHGPSASTQLIVADLVDRTAAQKYSPDFSDVSVESKKFDQAGERWGWAWWQAAPCCDRAWHSEAAMPAGASACPAPFLEAFAVIREGLQQGDHRQWTRMAPPGWRSLPRHTHSPSVVSPKTPPPTHQPNPPHPTAPPSRSNNHCHPHTHCHPHKTAVPEAP